MLEYIYLDVMVRDFNIKICNNSYFICICYVDNVNFVCIFIVNYVI